jgi:hypothetical protein
MFAVPGTGDKLEVHLDRQGATVELQIGNQLGHVRTVGDLAWLAVEENPHAVTPQRLLREH